MWRYSVFFRLDSNLLVGLEFSFNLAEEFPAREPCDRTDRVSKNRINREQVARDSSRQQQWIGQPWPGGDGPTLRITTESENKQQKKVSRNSAKQN